MKFLLEQNLFKTARWLRFLGCDVTVIGGAVNKSELKSNRDRIFITTSEKWNETLESLGIKHMVVPREDWKRQLCLVIKHFGIPAALCLDRCARCGTKLQETSPDEIRNRVPENTFEFTTVFYVCTTCDKIYWFGSHYEKIKRRLEEITNLC